MIPCKKTTESKGSWKKLIKWKQIKQKKIQDGKIMILWFHDWQNLHSMWSFDHNFIFLIIHTMWYNITIWKAQIFYDPEEKYLCLHAKWEKHDNAPAFWEPTDFENQRWPSYSSWADFLDFVWLTDLFNNNEDWLMREHPWCFPFNQSDLGKVRQAIKNLKQKYPEIEAKFNFDNKTFDTREEYYKYISENPMFVAWWHLCRLLWLEYWMDHALQNYKIPIIENT